MRFTVDLTVLDADGTTFGMECRLCGPLTIMAGTFEDAREYGYEHLQSHGCTVNTTVEDPE